jgi:hypothetical protein
MANYFPVALNGTTRSWLMNLPDGSLTSSGELCHQFTANIVSAYTHPGNEVDHHAMQQRGSHYGPSSSSSLRFKIPSPTSLTLQQMRRCLRS